MSKENRETGLLTRTTNSRIWQVGLEGIMEDKITKNMDNEKLARATKWGIRVFTSAALAATAWGCKNGWVSVDSTPDPTTSTEIVPPTEASIARGSLIEIVDQVEKTAIINSLPENRPQAKYENERTDVFKIGTTNTTSKFVMYELSDEEVQNGMAIIFDGQPLIQNVALFTEKTDLEGNTSWVRLIAIAVPSNESETEKSIVWVYDEKGFPTQENENVSLNRPVLSYPIPNTTGKVLFSPLLPADPSPIEGWDGFNPFYVEIQGNIPETFNVNANITHIEIPTPEATATPEAPKMTLEDWEKIFKETTFIGLNGKEYTVYDELFTYSNLVTDSNTIRNLENSAGITILGKDGKIILPINKDKASDIIDSGLAVAALVTKDRGGPIAPNASLMVIVAGQAYKNSGGESKIHITFDEVDPWPDANDSSSDVLIKYIETFTGPDGTITAPYMDMPPHFKMGRGDRFPVSLDDLGLEYNVYNWLDVCIKAGTKAILIYGW